MDFCMNGALVVPQSILKTRLTAMVAADGELDAAKVALIVNDFVATPQTALSDLTLASFVTSTPVDAVWGSVYNMPDGGVGVNGGAPVWVYASGTAQTVYGYAITNAAGNALLGTRRLAVPQSLAVAGDHIQVNVEYVLPGPVGDIVPVV